MNGLWRIAASSTVRRWRRSSTRTCRAALAPGGRRPRRGAHRLEPERVLTEVRPRVVHDPRPVERRRARDELRPGSEVWARERREPAHHLRGLRAGLDRPRVGLAALLAGRADGSDQGGEAIDLPLRPRSHHRAELHEGVAPVHRAARLHVHHDPHVAHVVTSMAVKGLEGGSARAEGHDPGQPLPGCTWGRYVELLVDEIGGFTALSDRLVHAARGRAEVPDRLHGRAASAYGDSPSAATSRAGSDVRWVVQLFTACLVPSSTTSTASWASTTRASPTSPRPCAPRRLLHEVRSTAASGSSSA